MQIFSYLPFSSLAINTYEFFQIQRKINNLSTILNQCNSSSTYQITQKRIEKAYDQIFIAREKALNSLLITIGCFPTTAIVFYIFRRLS